VKQTLNVLVDRAAEHGVEHVVFLSVAGAERSRFVPHHAVEQHLMGGKLAWTLLRAGFFAQNLADAYRRDLLEDNRIYVPAKAGRVAFVDVRDLADLAALAFNAPALRNQAWALAGPEAVSFREVAAMLTEALGRPIRYEHASLPGYIRHLRGRGMPWMQVAVITGLHVGLRMGNASRADSTLARLLGRAPRTMREFIADHLALWRPGGSHD
jgi:uncharacterized protein YbjT (DUF2867 family)